MKLTILHQTFEHRSLGQTLASYSLGGKAQLSGVIKAASIYLSNYLFIYCLKVSQMKIFKQKIIFYTQLDTSLNYFACTCNNRKTLFFKHQIFILKYLKKTTNFANGYEKKIEFQSPISLTSDFWNVSIPQKFSKSVCSNISYKCLIALLNSVGCVEHTSFCQKTAHFSSQLMKRKNNVQFMSKIRVKNIGISQFTYDNLFNYFEIRLGPSSNVVYIKINFASNVHKIKKTLVGICVNELFYTVQGAHHANVPTRLSKGL